jgi:multicomponent Na+:H+ antiporter subunit E
MNLILLTLVFAFGWAAATGEVSLPSLVFGALIGSVALFVIRAHVSGPTGMGRLRRIARLKLLFWRELWLSAFRVARLVLRPDLERHLRPAIVAYPLNVTRDAEITLLANLITLTPGTLSVEVTEDRKHLLIHAIDLGDRDAFIAEIRDGFEKRVKEVFE